jgi:L-ascorbate metabolism protein UlaG (beta-lactamase superfamily)
MRFTNLKGNFRKPEAVRVLQWLLGWHSEKYPRSPATGVAVPFVQNDGKLLRHSRRDTLTWIGQASFLVQLGGTSLLIDPVLSPKLGWVKRNSPPGLDWHTLPDIDIVLITHNHRDHMDAPTLKKLGKDPVYVVPKGLGYWFYRNGMRRVVEMTWWQEEEIQGVFITFVPAEHWSRRSLTDLNTSWWGGFVMQRNGLSLYHAGDSGWFDGFAEIGRRVTNLHMAMLPIGAYAPRWFMSPQHISPDEAVKAFIASGAKHLFPMHWGTFKLSDEALDDPPKALRLAWEAANLPSAAMRLPPLGETLFLSRFA